MEGDDSTAEVFPQLAQISLKVLKLHLRGLKKILGLRQRVDARLFASILVKHNTFMHKNHTWMSKSIPLKHQRPRPRLPGAPSEMEIKVFRGPRARICGGNGEDAADPGAPRSTEPVQGENCNFLHYECESFHAG